MIKDYYQILGVSYNADQKEIKESFRNLVKKYHPDVSNEQDHSQKFKEHYEAYEILRDQKRKEIYDAQFFKTKNVQYEFTVVNIYVIIEQWQNEINTDFKLFKRLDIKRFIKITVDRVSYHTNKAIDTFILVFLIICSSLAILGITFLVTLFLASPDFETFELFFLPIIFSTGIILFTRNNFRKYKKFYSNKTRTPN